MANEPETPQTKTTRANLISFVNVTNLALSDIHRQVQLKTVTDYSVLNSNLRVLYGEAEKSLSSLLQAFQHGLNRKVVRKLQQVGLYWDVLKSKLEILFDCIRDGSLQSVLTAFNSILGSLATVFGAADFIKEFKEMLEVALERLGPQTDPITLKLTLPDLE